MVDVDPVTGLVADPATATEAMASRAGVAVAFSRHAADGSVVVQLPSPLTNDEARNVAQRLMADPAEIDGVLRTGAERARGLSDPIVRQVEDIVGFLHP